MIAKGDDRIWARTDRTMAPPQRTFARRMRKEPTEAERKLWWHLRHRLNLDGSHFRRQVQIGPFIADFANHALRLIVEIDGGQHGATIAKVGCARVGLNPKVIAFCAFGITTCFRISMA